MSVTFVRSVLESSSRILFVPEVCNSFIVVKKVFWPFSAVKLIENIHAPSKYCNSVHMHQSSTQNISYSTHVLYKYKLYIILFPGDCKIKGAAQWLYHNIGSESVRNMRFQMLYSIHINSLGYIAYRFC